MNNFYKYDKDINGDSMKVREIMNKNIIIANKDDKVWEVAKKMKKHNIGFLPVIDNSRIIGVITDRDIVINCISNNNDKNETVENYMNKNIVSINLDSSVNDALNLMATNKIKRLIVDDNKKVVGIISLSNILATNLNDDVINSIRCIWSIKDNEKNKNTEIDEFYL